jgi:hypothetical protein
LPKAVLADKFLNNLSKVLASIGPNNGPEAKNRLLQLPHFIYIVACDAQEREPSLTSPTVKGNRNAGVCAKARKKLVMQAVI